MKKALLLVGILLSLALVSCADDPFANNAGNVSAGNIQVALDDNPAASGISKGITVGSSHVTNAVITLTGPNGVQTATWNLGGSKTFTFNADVTGNYTLGLRQVDTSNFVSTTNVTYSFTSGYDYYITITLGGNVIVNIGTNATLPSSASSVASSVSSVSSASSVSSVSSASSVSSVSSVSSSSSSVANGATFGLYSETVPLGVIWDTSCKLFVWADYGAANSIADDTINPAAEGTKSWRIVCTSTNVANPWFGIGISWFNKTTGDSTGYTDLSGYNYVNFSIRTTKQWKIGIKDGLGDEAWMTASQSYTYGARTNNAWSTVKIPLSAFTGVDTHYVNQYFMFSSDITLGCLKQDTYWLDNIYFSQN